MKKFIILFGILLMFVLGIASSSIVQATVGGETVVYNFTYNPVNESVYFIEQSFGGRGCPPELFKMSLNTGKTDIVYSCSEGEKIAVGSGKTAGSVISGMVENFKSLTPLNLKKNNISIDVDFVREEKFAELDEVKYRHFTATVYQNNTKIGDLAITGCNIEQPFLFQGYAIPGFDKRIVLLSSRKGDCFEGGYTVESLYSLAGFDNLNKVVDTNFYKGSSPLVPNEGNLVVYESGKINSSTISIRQFIELLIQIGVITPDKVNVARIIFGL